MAGIPTRTNDDGSVTEIALSHCRNGHELGPRRVSIGYKRCDCHNGPAHRTYTCVQCGVVDHLPRCFKPGAGQVGSGYFKG